MFFINQVGDYKVTGTCEDHAGHKIAENRICHNMSKREAKQEMKLHLMQRYANAINLSVPIRVKALQMVHKSNK